MGRGKNVNLIDFVQEVTGNDFYRPASIFFFFLFLCLVCAFLSNIYKKRGVESLVSKGKETKIAKARRVISTEST